MEKFWLFALILLWSGLAQAEEVKDVAQKKVTVAEVLQKSAQAYDALQSYSGTTTVVSETVVLGTVAGDITLKQKADAHIQFMRPGKIRIDGHDTGGRPFAISSNGTNTWSSWELTNAGKFEEALDIQQALSRMVGVASNAATHISSILLKLDWGFPVRQMEGSELKETEVVEGVQCYKIVRENFKMTETYWIDSKTFFLRQYKMEQDEDQVSNSLNGMSDKAKDQLNKNAPNLKIKSRSALHTFTIDGIDTALDEKLFQNPMSQN